LIDRFNVFYDRNVINHLDHNLQHYQLVQYRKLYPKSYYTDANATFPWYIRTPLNLIWFKYFLISWFIRSFSIVFIKPVTATIERKILIGTAFLEKDSPIIELTITFWTMICIQFLLFCVPKRLVDYKFLSLNSMSENDNQYRHPSNFGLDSIHFQRFKTFRKISWLLYHIYMQSVPPMVFITLQALSVRRGYYRRSPIRSTLWTLNYATMAYVVCNVLFSNLVIFIIIAAYIRIKQHCITLAIQQSMTKMYKNEQCNYNRNSKFVQFKWIFWNKFMRENIRYSHLYEEMAEYNHFFTSYITTVFVAYLCLFAYIVYVILWGNSELKILYILLLIINVLILGAITYVCGCVVQQQVQHSRRFTSTIFRFDVDHLRHFHNNFKIKIGNMSSNMNILSQSGFTFLNEYVMTHDTFRLLIVNVTIYFLLMLNDIFLTI
ncbi:hypothetical protein BLOT_016307, partial [Blomia tropicalis]